MSLETIVLAIGETDADRIQTLVDETIDVAKPTGATVILAHVFSPSEYDTALENLDFDDPAAEVTPDDVAERYSTIRQAVATLADHGVTYEVRGLVGDSGEEITDLATAVDADRVVVGGRHRTPAGKVVFGSTAQEILLSSPAPVTFIRSD